MKLMHTKVGRRVVSEMTCFVLGEIQDLKSDRRVVLYCLCDLIAHWHLALSTACQRHRSCHVMRCGNLRNKKKPALTRVQRSTPAMFSVSWPLTFNPEIIEFPGLIVEHFYVKLGDPDCSRTDNRR